MPPQLSSRPEVKRSASVLWELSNGRAWNDRSLFERYLLEGDPVDRQALIERFLPLARQLAGRYQRAAVPFDDLFQVACVGLIKAIDRFDLEALHAAGAYRAASLDAPCGNDGDSDDTLGDTLSVEDHRIERAEDRATLACLARRITRREREVLRLRFVEDLTQAEIGDRIGLSQIQVSRVIRQALARLQVSAGTHVASSVSRSRPAA